MLAVLQDDEEDDPFSNEVLVSSEYHGCSLVTVIEHCGLMTSGNEWRFAVKCRPVRQLQNQRAWRSVKEVCPDAQVKVKHNDIELRLSFLREDLVFAAFGVAGQDDRKRMQMGIYAGTPVQGRTWKIWAYVFDDTIMAFKRVCKQEETRGHRLLTPLAGLFVSNTSENITIEFSGLEDGWRFKGNSVQTIEATKAWNSPENCTDFPRCVFEIKHFDTRKRSFFCEVAATHGTDSAKTEIVAYYEQCLTG